tara:strand:- start:285 stop:542 length:258 start_codon:yes stop_codon:yes gene_type:complete
MSFNNQIPHNEPGGDHAKEVLAMLDMDFESYLIFGYLKDGKRVLMSKGKNSASADSINQAINVLRMQLSSWSEENDENKENPEGE